MKKAKIMLMTIAVVASIGTALAFKAHKFGLDTYCYLETTSQPADGSCTNSITKSTAQSTGITTYFYTLKPINTPCSSPTLACPSTARSFIN